MLLKNAAIFVSGCIVALALYFVWTQSTTTEHNVAEADVVQNTETQTGSKDDYQSIISTKPVDAENRFALLIGNEDYPNEVGPLELPHEDVERIKKALLKAHFPEANIHVLLDGDRDEIFEAVDALSSKLRLSKGKGVGFFYYSGHGGSTEYGGTRRNFFVPTGRVITTGKQLVDHAVGLDRIIFDLAEANAAATFVIADACRNTFPISTAKGGQRDKGFTQVSRRAGLYIAFATGDGQITEDDGKFSRMLAEEIPVPGRDYYKTMRRALARFGDGREIEHQPFVTDAISGEFCFAGCGVIGLPALPDWNDVDPEERKQWGDAVRAINLTAIADYLTAYPEGAYSETAQLFQDLLNDQLFADPSGLGAPQLQQLSVTDFDPRIADTMNPYILETVRFLKENREGLGYDLSGVFTEDLKYGSATFRATKGGATMTAAATMEILIRSITLWAEENNDSSPFEAMPPERWMSGNSASMRPWLLLWNLQERIPSYERTFGVGARDAFLIHGIGRGIEFQNAVPGDILYFNRAQSGHSGIFLGFINRSQQVIESYSSEIVGFVYYSAQNGEAPGLGERYAYFENFCPSEAIAGTRRDCGIIRSDDHKVLSVSRLHSPETWNTDPQNVDLALEYVFSEFGSFAKLQDIRWGEGH